MIFNVKVANVFLCSAFSTPSCTDDVIVCTYEGVFGIPGVAIQAAAQFDQDIAHHECQVESGQVVLVERGLQETGWQSV